MVNIVPNVIKLYMIKNGFVLLRKYVFYEDKVFNIGTDICEWFSNEI